VGVRVAEEQRCFECTPLDRRQLGQDIGGHTAEEVRQPRVRELRLGLSGAAGEESVAAFDSGVDPGQPERRLADPRLAVQQDGTGELLAGIELPDDRRKLVLSR
jgi:hypothetical protein